MMFRSEFKKIVTTKLFSIIFVLLLIINALVVIYVQKDKKNTDYEGVRILLDLFNKSPEEYKQLCGDITANNNKLLWDKRAELAKNEEFMEYEDLLDLVLTQDIDGVHKDLVIIADAGAIVNEKTNGLSKIENIIAQAMREMVDLKDKGVSSDEYLYQYEAYVYTSYSSLKNTLDKNAIYTGGADDYFSYTSGNIFIFTLVMILAVLVYIPDKQQGMTPIIHSCKNGREKSALVKLAVLAVFCVIIVLSFTLETFLITVLKQGFIDFGADIQNVNSLNVFAYKMSVGGFFFLDILFKILATVAFAMLASLLTLFCRGYLTSGIISLLLFALNFGLSRLPLGSHNALRVLNLFSLENFVPLCDRFYSFNVFSGVTPYFIVGVIAVPILILLLIPLNVLIYTRTRKVGNGRQVFKTLINKTSLFFGRIFDKIFPKGLIGSGKKSIFSWEFRKVFFTPGMIIVLAAFLVLEGFFVAKIKSDYVNDGEYRDFLTYYFDDVKGEYNEETEKFIANEKKRIDILIAKHDICQSHPDAYSDEREEIERNYQEYMKMKSAYEYLTNEASRYAEIVNKKEILPHFARKEGFTAFAQSGASIALFGILIIFAVQTFSLEYSGRNETTRFASILRTTKCGRKKTFRSKMLLSALLGFLLSVIFYGIEFITYLGVYNVPREVYSAPVISFLPFSESDSALTVLQYILIAFAVRVLFAVLFAIFCNCISCIGQKALNSLATILIVAGLPYALYTVGLEIAGYADMISLAGFNKMYLFSSGKNLFGSDFGAIILFAAVFTVLTAILYAIARRKFVK